MKATFRILFLFAFCIIISSCSKNMIEKQDDSSIEFSNAVSEVAQFEVFNQLLIDADQISDLYENFNYLKSAQFNVDCKVVTTTREEGKKYPVTFTIDFGEGCTLASGHVNKGKIIIVQDGPKKKNKAVRTITYSDFYVDGVKYEGTKTITTNKEPKGLFSFDTEYNVSIIKNDTLTITRVGTENRIWIVGDATPEAADDEYMVSGSLVISRTIGNSFTRTIVEPLHISVACKYPTKGIVTFASEGLSSVTLDYGNDECDSFATLTSGETSIEIDLSKKWSKWPKETVTVENK